MFAVSDSNKYSVSLPSESMAQLELLAKHWRMPSTVKRSQVIQYAIWYAYTDALCSNDKVIIDSDNVDDYIV